MCLLQVQAWLWAMAMPPGSMHCMKERKPGISISPLESKPDPEVVGTATTLAAKKSMVLSMTDMTAAILATAAGTWNMLVHAPHLRADGGGSCLLVQQLCLLDRPSIP